jgi:hypothetical protein
MSFGSSANYFVAANQAALTNLEVTIDVTEDIVPLVLAVKQQPQNPVFTFQINCYAANVAGPGGNSQWQQFVFTVSQDGAGGGKITALVENWPSPAYAAIIGSGNNDFINSSYSDNIANNQPVALLSSPKLPKGYQLRVTLGTDGEGNVVSATFAAYDNFGNQLLQNHNILGNTVNILGNLYTRAGTKAGPNDVSPIVAVQVNLVGSNEGQTVLSSGAGTIVHSSGLQTLNALAQEPAWVEFQGGSYEGANSVYAETQSFASFPLEEPFAVVTYTPGQPLAATRQFGTTNRTDVFAIGSTGQLTLFYVEDSGVWREHPPIGPASFPPTGSAFAPPGAQLAVSQQFGLSNRTNIFVVDNTGTLNFFYCDNGDPAGWQGALPISAAGFAAPGAWLAACQRAANPNQTDVYVVDNSGTLNVFSVVGGGNWSGPTQISAAGFAPAGAPVAASQRYGVANQTDVYVAETAGAMNVFSVGSSGAWEGPFVISRPGLEAPPWASIVAAPRAGVEPEVAFDDVPAKSFIAATAQFGVAGQTDVLMINSLTPQQVPGVGWPCVFWVVNAGPWSGPDSLVLQV